MLVRLNPSSLAEELGAVNASIVQLFEAIVTAANYEEATAAWGHANLKRVAVEKVLTLDPGARRELFEAIREDMGFDPRGDDHAFAFPQLGPAVRAAAKPLLASMYGDIFKRGGFLLAGGEQANRKTWEQAFREANPDLRICPACFEAVLEERIAGRSAVDLDHYLPKSVYPGLCVHGLNLVPLCKTCNTTAKGGADPLLDDGKRLHLSSIWFPYGASGLDEARLVFDPEAQSPQLVRLRGSEGAAERARRFETLFHLAERWSKRLEGTHDSICMVLRTEGVARSTTAVRNRIELIGKVNASERHTSPGAYLASCYCQWLVEDDSALTVLVESLDLDA